MYFVLPARTNRTPTTKTAFQRKKTINQKTKPLKKKLIKYDMKAKTAIKTLEKWTNRLLETNLMDFKEDRTDLLEALKKIKKLAKPKA